MKKILMVLTCGMALSAVAYSQDACGGCEGGKDAFLLEAERMTMQAEGKESCCKSTPAKPMAKGDDGCCNAKTALAKFKVFANGSYQFFGCKDSAAQARKQMAAKGWVVGRVQSVKSKSARIG